MSINKEAVERMNDNNVMIYQDENGITKVSVRFSDEDIWVTQQQLAEAMTLRNRTSPTYRWHLQRRRAYAGGN